MNARDETVNLLLEELNFLRGVISQHEHALSRVRELCDHAISETADDPGWLTVQDVRSAVSVR